MKKLILSIALTFAAVFGCQAQSLVKMPVAQNPLFEVSTNEVNVSAGDAPEVTLGGDLVVKGGSGSYVYRWYNNAGNNLGTDATLCVSTPGAYFLDIKDTCDCLQTVRFNVTNAGVNVITADALRLSPNPTDGPVEVAGFDAVQIAVVAMSGQMVALIDMDGEPVRSFDLSNLPAGQYIATLSDAEGHTAVARIIKK